MHRNEEEKLSEYKTSFDEVLIPTDRLDHAILEGFQRAKSEGRRKPRTPKWVVTVTAAALIILGFGSSIRMSPAFAGYISTIPGMDRIVELISYDKGLMSAIEHDYYQKVDLSAEKNGLKVVIDGVIADEQGLVVFYTFQSKDKVKEFKIDSANLKSLEGEELNASSSFSTYHQSEGGKKSYSDNLEYYFEKPLQSRHLEVVLKVSGDQNKGEFKIPIVIEDIQKHRTYEVNQTVTIEKQNIEIIDVKISPLRAGVHIKMDASNSKKLLAFEDLKIVDEHGESWGQIANGVSGSLISADEQIVYLQSNYFRNPKELYLVMNKIQAVKKDQTYVTVDTKQKKILKQPDGNRLSEMKMEGDNLSFTLDKVVKKNHMYNPFGEINDGNGKLIKANEMYSRGSEESNLSEIGVVIPKLNEQINPLSFEITSFPSWIEGETRIKIK